MRTLKTLKLSQKETRGLLKRFGLGFLGVRYRYDEDRLEHMKTVELVAQCRPSGVGAECGASRSSVERETDAQRRYDLSSNVAGRQVALRVGWRERVAGTGEVGRWSLGSGSEGLGAPAGDGGAVGTVGSIVGGGGF